MPPICPVNIKMITTNTTITIIAIMIVLSGNPWPRVVGLMCLSPYNMLFRSDYPHMQLWPWGL
jgi:hypothetical protein